MPNPTAVVIVNLESSAYGPGKRPIVSHGVDLVTGQSFCLPALSPADVGARFDPDYGEYVLDEPSSPRP